jgi:hypothetical protein
MLGLAIAALLGVVPSAGAADRWIQTGSTITRVTYWQGIAFDPGSRSYFFDGPGIGLWRTDGSLHQTAGRGTGIPASVRRAVGWNHLGDLTFDATGGGRLIVPLECYPNTCRTGGFGVVDPRTLAWRYAVKLDRREIVKAMWVETSADGRWAWTSAGTTLLAYDASQISAARAKGAPLVAARRYPGLLRASGVSGAALQGDRLYLAYDRGAYVQVLSYPVDPETGDVGRRWRLEIQRRKTSALWESEGLTAGPTSATTLRWQIQPRTPLYTRILSFRPVTG